MSDSVEKLILGSRSPRRLELLALLLPRDRIEVRAPADPSEAGFEGLMEIAHIEQRLAEIARAKNADVAAQPGCADQAILTADTTIVGLGADGLPAVLGQPPDDETWRDVVRDWFSRYYLGTSHTAMTAVCLRTPGGRLYETQSRTEVRFLREGERWLDWYAPPSQPTTLGGEPAARVESQEDTNNAEDDHGPHGAGPNGGIVFDFGEHHAEFTVDHEKRECAILVLGEDEKTPATVSAQDFTVTIKAFTSKEGTSVPAMNIDLFGDAAVEGKASRFFGTHPDLANVADYEGVAFAEIDGKPSQGEFNEAPADGTR